MSSVGRPYFAMELVEGIPITRYCDENRLTVRHRLELFIPVCQAVQHAHQKGVIHRDLKPSNVLIAGCDGKPIAKVIDFGVAKAAVPKLTEHTMVTGLGGIVGTLEYMSPEQAEFNAVDIDTRSDIYSLGVLLYELLTGSTPLPRQRLKAVGPAEALRLIREEQPARPSARLKEAREILPLVAQQRRTDAAKLPRLLRGDLDWLVLKALEKDRDRRYETANSLALDIERYLHDEPVLASPPSTGNRLRKFARRNQGTLLAAALVLLALLGGMVGTALGLVEAWRQRDAAEAAQQNEERQRLAAEAAQRNEEGQRLAAEAESKRAMLAEAKAMKSAEAALKKEHEARQSEKEARALWEFFKTHVVEAARPLDRNVGLHIDVSIATALHNAEPAIAAAFQDQPRVEATLRHTLGGLYLATGKYRLAIEQSKQALKLCQDLLGPNHPETLVIKSNLALAYHGSGRVPEAVKLNEELLEIRQATSGPDNVATLNSMQNLASAYIDAGRPDDALALYLQALKLRKNKYGPAEPDTLLAANALATAYLYLKRPAEALLLIEQSLELARAHLPAGHRTTEVLMINLAEVRSQQKRPHDVLAVRQEILALNIQALGPNHEETLEAMSDLGMAQWEAGQQKEALATLETAAARCKQSLGLEHPTTMSAMNKQAFAYMQVGKHKDAINLYEVTLKYFKDHPVVDVPKTWFKERHTRRIYPGLVATVGNLADCYLMAGRAKDAIPLAEQSLELARSRLGPKNQNTQFRIHNLARVYQEVGRLQDALPLAKEALALYRELIGADDANAFTIMDTLGSIYFDLGRFQDAESVMKVCAQGTRKQLGIDHPTTQLRLSNYADCLQFFQPEKGEPVRRELAAVAKKQHGPESSEFAVRLGQLGRTLVVGGKFAEAEPLLRECLRIGQKLPPESWSNYVTISWLGASLAGQKQFTEAEPLLLQGYEGLNQRRDKMSKRAVQAHIPQALEKLVDLYQAWDRPDQAEKWRKELETYKQK